MRINVTSSIGTSSISHSTPPSTTNTSVTPTTPLENHTTGMGSVNNFSGVTVTKNGVAPTQQIKTESSGTVVTNLTPVASPRQTAPNSMMTTGAKPVARVLTTQTVTRSQQPGSVLPSGISIPPGMVLARNQNGQLLLVSSNSISASAPGTATAMSVPATSSINSSSTVVQNDTTQIKTEQQTATTRVATTAKPPESGQLQQPRNTQSISLSQEDVVNVSKCRNFLTTLIKLASSGGQSVETVSEVKKLVQDLIDDKIQPEYFTQQLQIKLNSAPQPYLVPFLKRSLPLLRLTMMQQSGGKGPIPQAVAAAAIKASSATPNSVGSPSGTITLPKPGTPVVKRPFAKPKGVKKSTVPDIRLPRVSSSPLNTSSGGFAGQNMGSMSAVRSNSAMPPPQTRIVQQKWASPSSVGGGGGGGGTFKDDDDINDVASMAGVNLSEESARILATNSELVGSQIRSCQDTTVVNSSLLERKITDIINKHTSVQQIDPNVIKFTAYAVEARIKDLMARVSLVAFHRLENFKDTEHYEASQDVKSQLKFLLQLDQLEKKRHAESEREVLMRAMKSRSKNEDPEQLRLKQRAKEMQQLEMERMQIQNADETARNAIGPRRKKLKVDLSSTPGSLAESSKDSFASPLRSTNFRPRIKRVNIRDLIFVMEQEKDLNKTNFLYKSYLK